MSKTPEYTRKAIAAYQAKHDNLTVRLPKGTKDRIKLLTGKSCNTYIADLVLGDLDRLESFTDQDEPGNDLEDDPVGAALRRIAEKEAREKQEKPTGL